MEAADFSRRRFLLQSAIGAGGAWLAAAWPEVLAAQQHAHHTMSEVAAGAPANLEYLTPGQAADVEAIASLIIPTTETPGAREAGVVYFVDRSLRTFAADQQKPFADALALVDGKRKERFPASADFASLTVAQQTEILKAIEETPAFGMFRFATVVGFLSNPEDGGNRDMVGWKLIGFDHAPTHTPPFGYYDAEYVAEQAAARKKAKPPTGAKP
ncbi:MAG TPA: gluconate 2-dehydrogenase subunit 3 family protein [Candidatus Acidoferrales bacterium]|nr:gluconate 2-dehydrogenase subunit 3 family protein [Candidatus Acidoferrales bacterium]